MKLASLFRTARNAIKRFPIWPERRRLASLGRLVEPNFLVIFVGNPRSGTTLVRSLLNAHPQVSISQELNLLAMFDDGERSWDYLVGAMIDNAKGFDAQPVWNGYSYHVDCAASGSDASIKIVGDKKAAHSAARIRNRSPIIEELLNWSPIPIKFIHCVRNPFDVIATKTNKNPYDLERNVGLYFEREQTTQLVKALVPATSYFSVHLEDLVADPRDEMLRLTEYLGLQASPAYIEACANLVFGDARKSRDTVQWTNQLRAQVQDGSQRVSYLMRYLDGE